MLEESMILDCAPGAPEIVEPEDRIFKRIAGAWLAAMLLLEATAGGAGGQFPVDVMKSINDEKYPGQAKGRERFKA